MSKESVERAERFKMNSRKSQDLLAAIKDSADKTANRIKNVSLTRRRPLNKKYTEEFREDSNAQHQKDIKIHIQRYQSHKQFDNNNSKKAENNNKRQSVKKTHSTPYQSQSTTGNNVKKQKRINAHPAVSTVQIKIESLTGSQSANLNTQKTPPMNEQTGQYVPDTTEDEQNEEGLQYKN